MKYEHVAGIRDPLKQDLALEFCGNQEKIINILTETHINPDPTQNKRNNWLGPSFSLLEIFTQKDCFFCFIWVLKVSEVDTDPKGKFVSSKVTPSNESFLLVPFQSIAPENNWLGSLFLRTTKSYAK